MWGILLASVLALAFDTVPLETGDFSDVIYPSQNQTGKQEETSSTDGIIELTVGCYGTNLRSVGNPIAPNSNITVAMQMNSETLNVHFSGQLARGTNASGQATVSGMGGINNSNVNTIGNKIIIRLPNYIRQTQIRTVDISDEGNVEETIDVTERDSLAFRNVTFTQSGVSGGQYYAKAGAITNVDFKKRVSTDGTKITGVVNFPGQNGFCGSFYSPIMVFFDDDRPMFQATSDFPLHEHVEKTYWPEKGSPGYFLALDRNGNGVIDHATELFGDADGEKHGFTALVRLDENGDKVLDRQDSSFKKLVLWKDANANGKSEKSEMMPLSAKQIQTLNLNYKREYISYGYRAEEREKSHFTYAKDGKTLKGALIDIWFAPAPEPAQVADLKN